MEINKGDVLAVYGVDPIDKGIEWAEGGDAPSHVAMFINDTTVCEAQGGRPVGEQSLDFYKAMIKDGARLEVWTDLTLTDAERYQMIEYAKFMYDLPYDYLLIPLEFAEMKLGMRIDWYHEHKHLICSTYLNDIAEHVGKDWSNGKTNPAPIDNIKCLKKKGDITL